MFSRRFVFLLAFISLIAGLAIGFQYSPDWNWIVDHEAALRKQVSSSPFFSWCLGLMAYFAISMIPGTAGKSVLCGWLFGFWGALLMVELGLTGAAIASYFLGRTVVHELVHHKWRQRLSDLSVHFTQDGATYLLMLRLVHAPFTLVNYGAGAVKIPISAFCWTTMVGILPGTVVFTFAGTRIPTLSVVSEQGVWTLIDPPLLVALILTAILPLVLRFLAGRLAKRLKSQGEGVRSAGAQE
jgi:uncharacterized membrane protein YdjX (TVP38/TMEM64 family)